MAGYEHAASLVRVVAEELAQPVHAFGIETVGGLVEDEYLGLAQQGCSQAEALAHSEREPLDPSVANVCETDFVEHLVGVGDS